MKKGQAAMEYLMTYGWALLAIVIVIAILVSMKDVMVGGEQCIGEIGIDCSNPMPGIVDGNLVASIKNGLGNKIAVIGINCSSGQTVEGYDPIAEQRVALGGTIDIVKSQAIKCYSDNGEVLDNERFQGYIHLKYYLANQESVNRTIKASFKTTAQKGG